MPSICFSFPADVPPGTGTRDAVQPDPPGLRRMPQGSGCFRYEADVPPGLRRMPSSTCFRYEAHAAQPGLRDPRRMPLSYPAYVPRSMPYSCFSYPAGAPLGAGNRGAAKPARPGLRRMPSSCFRY